MIPTLPPTFRRIGRALANLSLIIVVNLYGFCSWLELLSQLLEMILEAALSAIGPHKRFALIIPQFKCFHLLLPTYAPFLER